MQHDQPERDWNELSTEAWHRQNMRDAAYLQGSQRPECAWISTSYDTWEPNPFYKGPPVEHPETYSYED